MVGKIILGASNPITTKLHHTPTPVGGGVKKLKKF